MTWVNLAYKKKLVKIIWGGLYVEHIGAKFQNNLVKTYMSQSHKFTRTRKIYYVNLATI